MKIDRIELFHVAIPLKRAAGFTRARADNDIAWLGPPG
jgi:hypothetical protein